jgi:aminoglycoside phosphotransferase family enzyme
VVCGCAGFLAPSSAPERIGLLDARAAERRIVEGHGDLRPEHVYLTDPPAIIDCIEFDRSLRVRDPADELAFLALEGERLGCPALDGWLFGAWRTLAADEVPRALVEFYKARNALVRARIAIWHLEDSGSGSAMPAQAWRDRAGDYLRRAEACIGRALA